MLFVLLTIRFISSIIIKIRRFYYGDYWNKRNVRTSKISITKNGKDKAPFPIKVKEIYEEYPDKPYVGTYQEGIPALVVRDLNNIGAVLAGDFTSFFKRGFNFNESDKLADNMLFSDNYPRWRLMRLKFAPIFSTLKVKSMFELVNRSAIDFVSYIEKNKVVKNPYKLISTYASSSIVAATFGVDVSSSNTVDSPLVNFVIGALRRPFLKEVKFFLADFFPTLFKLFNISVFRDQEEFLIGFVKSVLEVRRKDNIIRKDFLGRCLELQQSGVLYDETTNYKLEITDEGIAAQAFFFFSAGGDTSTNVLNFTLLELSQNKDILDKVHNEIDTVFDDCKENMTFAEYEKLTYIQMVLDETMRKYPPVGLVTRKCNKTTKLPIGDVVIQKDKVVIVPIFGIHRDPKYYLNPDVFDPERFLPKNTVNLKKLTNLAFSDGNRSCFGSKFARMQMGIGLAWLLRRFTLESGDGRPQEFEFSVFGICDRNADYKIVPRNR